MRTTFPSTARLDSSAPSIQSGQPSSIQSWGIQSPSHLHKYKIMFFYYITYGGRRLYQYNEDDFLLIMLWLFTSVFQSACFHVSKVKLFTCLCVYVILLFKTLVGTKTLSSLYWYIRRRLTLSKCQPFQSNHFASYSWHVWALFIR